MIVSREKSMQEDKKLRLQELLEQQKHRIYNAKINDQKEYILKEIPQFHQHYQFADKEDIIKLKMFLKSLPTLISIRLDFSQLPIWHVIKSFKDINDHFNVWICFLSGLPELFELYPYGDIQDFINDFDSWQYISPYLILVCDNFKDFIFIDDEKKMIQSQNT